MEEKQQKKNFKFISKHPKIYSVRYNFINDWIGQRLGYGKDFKYKTWDELFTKRKEKQ